jgi:hypothetical protein
MSEETLSFMRPGGMARSPASANTSTRPSSTTRLQSGSRRCAAALRRLSLAGFVGLALLAGCGGDDEPSESERDRAVAAAMKAYERAAATGLDLDRGPCIAETLPGLPDWVADIAHDPRTEIDDDPANQCRRYREGEASHFVELDPGGRLIRAE